MYHLLAPSVCLSVSISVSVSVSVSLSLSLCLCLSVSVSLSPPPPPPLSLSANNLSLICSFVNSRLQRVSLKDNQSDFKTVLFGVPEGSVLGRLLFCIYINDLPLLVPSAQCDMLANDTAIHTSGQDVPAITSILQSCLSDVVEWTHLSQMSLNPSKTKHMILTTRQKRQLVNYFTHHLRIFPLVTNK